jgi:RNA polymerase sigma-70 factor (ECF subfamily)
MNLPLALSGRSNVIWASALQARRLPRSAEVQQDVRRGEDTVDFLQPSSPEILFRQSYRSIVQSLALAGGNLAAAEEATQEAFIEALIRWNRISRYDNPAVWVRRVAINKLHKMHRSSARGAVAVLRLGAGEPVASPPDEPDTSLLVALATLSPRQRLASVLYYVEDLTIAEVAALMGISPGAVSQHLNRARTALRTHLEPAP